MARIKIKDLPKNQKISKDEMRLVAGGFCGDGKVIMKGLGCVDASHLAGLYENEEITVGKKVAAPGTAKSGSNRSDLLAASTQTKIKTK